MFDDDPIYAAALAYANEVRAADGLEPLDALPKGLWKAGGDNCPLGRACPGWFFNACGTRYRMSEDRPESVALPLLVEEFIDRFDSRAFPELIEDPA